MENIKTLINSKTTESAESLWEKFENSGSIKDYLRFLQKNEDHEELEPSYTSF